MFIVENKFLDIFGKKKIENGYLIRKIYVFSKNKIMVLFKEVRF